MTSRPLFMRPRDDQSIDDFAESLAAALNEMLGHTKPKAAPVRKIAELGKDQISLVEEGPTKTKVFGWASVAFTEDGSQVLDLQGHMIDVDELEKAAYKFVAKAGVRPSGEMHKSDPSGNLIESVVMTPEKRDAMGISSDSIPVGWWVGFEMPSEVIAKVLDGTYGMFSIEGRGILEPVD